MVSPRNTCLLLVVASLCAATGASARLLFGGTTRCPPTGFDALQGFNITEFIGDGISIPRRWFVQQQEPLIYQPRNNLFCVVAEYKTIESGGDPLDGVVVSNYANRGAVNGPVVGTDEVGGTFSTRLLATVPDPVQPSKLKVGPSLLGWWSDTQNPFTTGDYWVLDAGQSADSADRSASAYDWAIISGGAPTRETDGGCATGSRLALFRAIQTNNIGLWLFTRKPVDPANTQLMRSRLVQLGLDASGLAPVTQEGCTYAGAPGQGLSG